jgi:sugar lactone lactonase YvrE
LYVEYAGTGIQQWDGTRAIAFWSGEHCGASGLIDYRNGHILVACYDANSIVELDRTGKQIRVIDRDSAGKPFVGPNDFAADRRGGIYVSASGVYDLKAPITGTILYMAAGGNALHDGIFHRAPSAPVFGDHDHQHLVEG